MMASWDGQMHPVYLKAVEVHWHTVQPCYASTERSRDVETAESNHREHLSLGVEGNNGPREAEKSEDKRNIRSFPREEGEARNV